MRRYIGLGGWKLKVIWKKEREEMDKGFMDVLFDSVCAAIGKIERTCRMNNHILKMRYGKSYV